MTSMSSVGPAPIAPYMVSAAAADNGGTFDAVTGKRATQHDGYWVGGIGPAFTVAYGDRLGQASAAESLSAIASALGPDYYVGAWLDRENNVMVWEVSEHFRHLSVAMLVASARDQRAVWDIARHEEVEVQYVHR